MRPSSHTSSILSTPSKANEFLFDELEWQARVRRRGPDAPPMQWVAAWGTGLLVGHIAQRRDGKRRQDGAK